MTRRLLRAIAMAGALAATPAFAACEDSAWNAGAAAAALNAATSVTVDGPLARTAPVALRLALAPQVEVAFALPPERAPRGETAHAAVVPFAAGEPGTIRVALSAKAWIDVVQDGRHVPDVAFSDFSDCPGLRKIVAFDIGAGPFTLQLSDAAEPAIAVAVIPAP